MSYSNSDALNAIVANGRGVEKHARCGEFTPAAHAMVRCWRPVNFSERPSVYGHRFIHIGTPFGARRNASDNSRVALKPGSLRIA
jgi:hypothetical protein